MAWRACKQKAKQVQALEPLYTKISTSKRGTCEEASATRRRSSDNLGKTSP
jgi:hypothetical protein